MDMTTGLVIGGAILLILSKIPDFVSTWQGISMTQNPSLEQNPIARWMFERWGVKLSLVLLAVVYLLVTIGSLFLFFPFVELTCELFPTIPPQFIVWSSTIMYATCSLFTALVQLQAAQYNQNGEVKQPLRWVYGHLHWFYRS